MKTTLRLGLPGVLLLSLFLNGCATRRAYEGALEDWKGKSERELIREWGEPTKISHLIDGGHLAIYLKENPNVGNVRSPSGEKSVRIYDCKTTFLVDANHRITSWKYEGSNCRR